MSQLPYTDEMKRLLKIHGYPDRTVGYKEPVFCEKAQTTTGMNSSEEDWGGQTEVCTICGKAWSCEYAGSNPKVNNAQCPNK